jgi:hypothetical protein
MYSICMWPGLKITGDRSPVKNPYNGYNGILIIHYNSITLMWKNKLNIIHKWFILFKMYFPLKPFKLLKTIDVKIIHNFHQLYFSTGCQNRFTLIVPRGRSTPPPPSDVQHSLEENSGIPYLSCEYYLLYWNLLPLNMRNTCKYCEGNLTNKRCVQNRDEPINR